jgi:hypothetical protein
MKNIRKSVFAVLAATILATVFIITACQQPMDGFSFGGGTPVPKNVVRVGFNFGGNGAGRTILPSLPTTYGTGATQYNYYVEAYLSGDDPDTDTPVASITLASAAGGTIQVPPNDSDDYFFYVQARYGGTTSAFNYATGTSSDVTLDSSDAGTTVSPINVQLNLLALTATGNGTLAYAINTSGLTGGVSAINLAVADRSTSTPLAFSPLNITAAPTGSVATPIPAGVYSVLLSVTKAGETLYLREVLHVYQNMTSTFATSWFTDSLFKPNVGGGIVIIPPSIPSHVIGIQVGSGSTNTSTAPGFTPNTIEVEISGVGVGTEDSVIEIIDPTPGLTLTSINWYWMDNATTPFNTGDTLTFEAGAAPYTEGQHLITVEATDSATGIDWSATFRLDILP